MRTILICGKSTTRWPFVSRNGKGSIENTHDQVSEKLSLRITSPELRHQAITTKKREQDQKRQASPDYKKSRLFAKMVNDHKMGKVDARKSHRSEKVPLEESAKSNISKSGGRGQSTCSICKEVGHTKVTCQMPQGRKRPMINFANLELDELRLAERSSE